MRLTHALGAADVRGVSGFTDAAEGAQRVQTLAVLTQIPHHLTLVDICRDITHRSSTVTHTLISTNTRAGGVTLAVGGVSGAQRAHLLVVRGPGQRADLTVGPPAAAPATTALGFSDADATAGTHLTHGLQNLQEAEALTVI